METRRNSRRENAVIVIVHALPYKHAGEDGLPGCLRALFLQLDPRRWSMQFSDGHGAEWHVAEGAGRGTKGTEKVLPDETSRRTTQHQAA